MRNYYQPEVVEVAHSGTMNRVLRQAYMLIALSMIPTIIGAFISVQTGVIFNLMLGSPILFFVGYMALFYGLVFAIEANKTTGVGVLLMLGLTFVMGLLLGPLLTLALQTGNGWKYIGVAAGGTMALFVALAALGSDATKNFSSLGKYLGATAIALMVTIVLNVIFLKLPVINLLLSMVIIPFSGAIILYRINSVVRGGENNYITVALDVYIALYNIFSSLLRLILTFANND